MRSLQIRTFVMLLALTCITSCHSGAQAFNAGPFNVVVEGTFSPTCDPRAGNRKNMVACALKGNIFGGNQTSTSFVLPWQTSAVTSVKTAGDVMLFFGTTQLGFEQVSMFSLSKKAFVYQQLAAKTALSPKSDYLLFQVYEPPHSGQSPNVRLALLPLQELSAPGQKSNSIIFEAVPAAGSEQAETGGTVRCSQSLYWKSDESSVGMCIRDLNKQDPRIVLVSTRGSAPASTLLDVPSLCANSGQLARFPCSVTVEQIGIEAEEVKAAVLTSGSAGDKHVSLSLPLTSFNR